MMKIIKLTIPLIMLISAGCSSDKLNKEQSSIVFSHEILDKKVFHFEKIPDDTLYIADIHLLMPDTTITYVEISNYVRTICINENIIAAFLFKSKECWSEFRATNDNQYIYNNDCVIGKLDLRFRGYNWKYSFKPEDIDFNVEGNLPSVITLR